jgi:porphobilinogen synthase
MDDFGSYPLRRMRRMRVSPFVRTLRKEISLSPADLIYPVFLVDSADESQDIASMPGLQRLCFRDLMKVAERCLALGVPGLALFPCIAPHLKSPDGHGAFDPQGILPRAIVQLKKHFPELGIITDVALDPYTSHGHDGLVDAKGQVLNDETVTVLKRQALCLAEAGADMVAPSDMMDGRIGAIRRSLDSQAMHSTAILAYSAKYASGFYGPFRDAVGSKVAAQEVDKRTYQLDPHNSDEAMMEIALDLQEGADIIMIKPGLPYLDIIRRAKDRFKVPTFAYQVSGEYAMLKAAGQKGWIDEKKCALESLVSLKRAGCDAILSYYALEAAQWLQG